MKNIYRSGILLGMGILLAGTFATTDSASAAPRRGGDRNDIKEERKDVREAAKDVREERKDVRKADTPRERLIERGELRQAERNLDRQKQDLNRERRDNNHNDGNNRPGRGDNDRWDNNRNDRWDNNRRDNDGRWNNNGNWNNGNWNNGGRSNSSIEGTVIRDLDGNDFVIRSRGGHEVRVIAQRGESKRISRGDYIRAYGYSDGGTFRAQNVDIVRNR